MKQPIYGIVGYKGKLGSLLSKRPNFVSIDCDITNEISIVNSYKDVDVLVNLAAISSTDECEDNPKRAFAVNIRGADNLLKVYGSRVLNIGSDYVFGGWKIFPPSESSKPYPLNIYGMTKIAMENLTVNTYGGKILRLSRTVHLDDPDISHAVHRLQYGQTTTVPSFFFRNYITRSQAVDGIEFAVRNFKLLPSVVNYGSNKPVSFFQFMTELSKVENLPAHLLGKRNEYDSNKTPRPKRSGFSVKLAKSLGFPIYNLMDVVNNLWKPQ